MKRRWAPSLLAAATGLILFAVTVGGTYVYDDFDVFSFDPRLREPSQWWRYFTESYNGGIDNLYRPLVSLTYAIQWQLHGDRPWAFHLVNVLLHAGNSALAAELARRLLNTRAAYVAGLLFAAHPIHVEAVANIVGRAELMCAAGTIGGLVLFLHSMTGRRALAITGCFLLAVLSKELGMLMPLLLLVLWLTRRFLPVAADSANESAAAIDPARSRQALLMLTLMLCWMLAGYIVWRESILKFWWDREFLDWTVNPLVKARAIDRRLVPLQILGRYTMLLIAPMKLSPDYGGTVIGWITDTRDPHLYIGAGAIVVWLAVLALAVERRNGPCIFATIALGIVYAPVSNLLMLIGTNMGERLMYLPSVFFLFLIAAAIAALPRWPMVVFLIIVILAASIRTFTYARRWNDRLRFHQLCLAEQPRSIRLHMLLVAEHLARGEYDAAADVVAAGRRLLPGYDEIWLQSGIVEMDRGNFDQAQRFFDTAVNLRPSFKTLGWMKRLEDRRRAAQPTTGMAH